MLNESKPHENQEKLIELQNFISRTKDVREWKRAQSVKLRLQGFSYREIEKRLEVLTSFIAQTQRKYISQGIDGLKLKYPGSKSYLKVDNQRERQTYYGALNLLTLEFIVRPYPAGNGENTVKFVEKLKRINPQKQILVTNWWLVLVSYQLSGDGEETLQRTNDYPHR